MTDYRKSTALMAGLLALSVAVPALAEYRGDKRDGWRHGGMHHGMGQCRHGGGKRHMRGMRGMGGMGGGPLKHVDGRLAFIKAELKLSDEQNAAWEDFASTLRTAVETRDAMRKQRREEREEKADDDDDKKVSLPERLAEREARASARLDRIKAMREGFDKFYAVLDDKQKETADELIPMMMRIGRGGKRWARGGQRGCMHGGMGRMGKRGGGAGMGPGMGRGMGQGMGPGMGRGMGMGPDGGAAPDDKPDEAKDN